MTHITRSVRIEAATGRVWGLIANLEGWPRWLDVPYATRSVTVTSPDPRGRGSEIVLRGRLSFRLFARVIDWDEGRSLRLEIFRSDYPSDRLFFARASAGFTLEQVGDSATRVTYDHSVQGKGPLGRLYMATIFRLLLRGNAARILAGLQRALEP